MRLLIAPLEALLDPRLSAPERHVLLALYSFRGKNTNTVWPKLETLANRANLKDQTRVSKITRSLASKGWLTKKKRGFTGGNEYTLTVPVEAQGSLVEASSNLDSDTKLDGKTILDSNTKSNLDSGTKSNLDSDAKNKEQTIDQTIEQGSRKRFIPPTIQEVEAYCLERGNRVDPESFVDHYEANGWMRGTSRVKDWRACVRTWEKSERNRVGRNAIDQELVF